MKEDFNEVEELTGATEKAGERRTVCYVEEASENISIKEGSEIVIKQDNADTIVKPITVNEENTPDGKFSAGYSEEPTLKKKRAINDMTREKQTVRQKDNPIKTYTDIERGLQRSSFELHPGKQEVLSIN